MSFRSNHFAIADATIAVKIGSFIVELAIIAPTDASSAATDANFAAKAATLTDIVATTAKNYQRCPSFTESVIENCLTALSDS